jgi:hypothetical protein
MELVEWYFSYDLNAQNIEKTEMRCLSHELLLYGLYAKIP